MPCIVISKLHCKLQTEAQIHMLCIDHPVPVHDTFCAAPAMYHSMNHTMIASLSTCMLHTLRLISMGTLCRLEDAFECVTYRETLFAHLDLRENVCQVTALRPLPHAFPSTSQAPHSTDNDVRQTNGIANNDGDEMAHESASQTHRQTHRLADAPRGSSARGSGNGGASAARGTHPDIIVGNIHVLFNPQRGDVKLAQVRHRSPAEFSWVLGNVRVL